MYDVLNLVGIEGNGEVLGQCGLQMEVLQRHTPNRGVQEKCRRTARKEFHKCSIRKRKEEECMVVCEECV